MTTMEVDRRRTAARPTRTVGRRAASAPSSAATELAPAVFELDKLEVFYGAFRAVRDVTLAIQQHQITAFIGPSGCGKTTVLRCFNRMNDLIPGARVERQAARTTASICTAPTSRRPRSAAASAWCSRSRTRSRRASTTTSRSARASTACATQASSTRSSRSRCAAPRCGTRSRIASSSSALGMSGGQQQRLCIARTIAVEPEVVLMDEPCSALDPIATARIEELMRELKQHVHDRDRHAQHAAGRARAAIARRSSRPRSTARPTSAPASSSSTTQLRRSSRTRATSGPRTTSPAASAESAHETKADAAHRLERPRDAAACGAGAGSRCRLRAR